MDKWLFVFLANNQKKDFFKKQLYIYYIYYSIYVVLSTRCQDLDFYTVLFLWLF